MGMGAGDGVHELCAEFACIGRDLLLTGLITTHGGNMSVRSGERMIITRRGAMLGRLGPEDLVDVPLREEDGCDPRASSEAVVHRAIYRGTSAAAVIHAHPPAATLLSLLQESILPVDAEGIHLLGRVPVVTAAETVGSAEAAAAVARSLAASPLAMLRGHGSFASGGTLAEALCFTSSLETSSRMLLWARSIGAPLLPPSSPA